MKPACLLIVVTLAGLLPNAVAQCPDREAVYEQLRSIEQLSDNTSIIKAATQLATQCDRCRATKDSVYAKLMHILGRSYWQSGQLDQGIAYTRKAIAINSLQTPLAREANLANSYNNLGQQLAEKNQYLAAHSVFDQAIRIAKKYPEKYFVGAIALVKKADLYFLQGDYQKANDIAKEGFALAKRANDIKMMVQNLAQQMQALLEMHRYSDAKKILNAALPLTHLLNNPKTEAYILTQEALLNTALGHYKAVIDTYQKAFEANKKADFRYGCAQTLTNLGFFYQLKMGNQVEAIRLYKQALTYLDDPNDQARVLDNLGTIYQQQKRYNEALTYFQKALLTLSIGFSEASFSANPSANVIQRIAKKEYFLTLVQDKADTWLDWGKETNNNPARLSNALKTYTLADTIIDYMRWEHTGQQSKLFWRDKTHRLYEQAIETCFRLKDAASAYRFIEKSRAVLLNDKLNELGANRQLSPKQAIEEERLQKRVSDWQTKLLTEKPNTSAYTKALDSLHTAQEQREAFVHQLEQTNPVYYRYKYDNSVLSLSQVQTQLAKRDASLVTYFVGDSSLYALGISPSGTKLIKLAASGYTTLANTLLALDASSDAQNQQFTRYLSVSNQLYNQLLYPLALKPGRVIVSPDGMLLPFEALSVSATKPDFLVNRYAFSYAYSINRLFKESIATSTGWANRTGSFLGMAPVRFSTRLNQLPLPGSNMVLQRIGDQFSSPTLLTGKLATRQAFRQQADTYQVIQLFTHAEADTLGHEPALFFSDSALHLSELSGSSLLSTELIGLSACKTGIGANQLGEGVFSLARGFTALGVPSILTTLWNVESEATYDLTERFYTKLAEGLPKDFALQQAKIDYLASVDLSGQLPNQWAGLLLIGDAEPLKKSMALVAWSAGLGILALGGIWWFSRRKRATSDT
ncbi:CHAT domain-containing protein [Spirosoma aerolatum]|uniref:CHAT domain-containing protein n=1 Tax=Spirosoma aerolatum TaxID=1211326 RepID=UPI0009AEFAF6|nr:CHAT domain-containing protein [Spirosoma aerolatum]